MGKRFVLEKAVFPAIIFSILFFTVNLSGHTNLSAQKITLLKVVAGIYHTFKYCADEIWPGYDLSGESYLVYMPNDFVLYLNGKKAPAEFEPYPPDWFDLGTNAFIHFGVYRDLVGQFAFDFSIDSTKTFAMGMPKDLLFSLENPSYTLLSTTIHEGFHQYQHTHFGEIPWAREELYPILDAENTALASMEMQILKDALKAMFEENSGRVDSLMKEFVAVRDYRWKHADTYVRKYEQGQEINEGTARYVEMKAMDCFFRRDTTRIQNRLFREIKQDLSGMTIRQLLIEDMEARLNGIAVPPDDMLRNRIYPVGAALGFLTDWLGIDWKMKFQAAGSEISFPGLLEEHFKLDSTRLSNLVARAKADFHYPKIRFSAQKLIDTYFAEYQKTLEKFNHQPGIRIEIHLSNNGIRRFRSTKNKKWIVKNGKKLLCLHYNLYSLKSLKKNGLLLEIHDKALLDENNWQTRRKTVTFYSAQISSIMLNGSSSERKEETDWRFTKLKIEGDNFRFEANTKGTIHYKKKKIIISLE